MDVSVTKPYYHCSKREVFNKSFLSKCDQIRSHHCLPTLKISLIIFASDYLE